MRITPLRPSLLLRLAVALLAIQVGLVASIARSGSQILIQDVSGVRIDRVLPESSGLALPVTASRRATVPGLGQFSRCEITPGLRLVSDTSRAQSCDYCFHIPGPYGCNDALCYDSLCQYVGACSGCNERYLPQCS